MRALVFPRFRGKKPEELPDLLDRLVEEMLDEVKALRALPPGIFPDGVQGELLSSAGSPHQLSLDRIHRVDMQAGNVDVRLPYARREQGGRAVGVLRIQAGNTLTVYPSGGQLVNATTSQTLATAGLSIYFWCGGEDGDTQGNWRLVV